MEFRAAAGRLRV